MQILKIDWKFLIIIFVMLYTPERIKTTLLFIIKGEWFTFEYFYDYGVVL